MKEPRRIMSKEYPQTFQKLGDNSYYYNYDIQTAVIQEYDLEQLTETDGYSYIQTHIYGNPNYNDCVKAIIREYLSADEEFDLINSYNSYQANLLDDESIATNYLNYLNLLKQIKQNIKKDFK